LREKYPNSTSKPDTIPKKISSPLNSLAYLNKVCVWVPSTQPQFLAFKSVHLARHLGVPSQRINEIVCSKRHLTPHTAWFFATTPEFWMNPQAHHHLTLSRPFKPVPCIPVAILQENQKPQPYRLRFDRVAGAGCGSFTG
jgi:hypothetical protein